MQEKNSRWLGVAVLLVGLFSLADESLSLIRPNGLLSVPGVSSGVLSAGSVFMFAEMLLFLGVRFWMWRFARQTPGAGTLLLAAIGGVVTMVSFGLPTLFVTAIDLIPSGLFSPLINSTYYVSLLLVAATLGVLCVGLLRSGFVPRWIVWLGFAAAGAALLGPTLGLMKLGLAGLADTLYGLLNAAFLLSLGVFLLRRSTGDTPPKPHMAVAFLTVLAALVAVTALASWAGIRDDVAEKARQEAATAYPSAFARLFPGFTDAGASPPEAGGGPSESSESTAATLQWFELKRGGAPFMPVGFINRRDMVSEAQGPVHGTPIAFEVPGVGTRYLGDNYFVADSASRYASIPRAQKLALWDAFVKAYPDKSRVLGVFPIGELRDRTLLRADGFAPETLNDCTLVVYATEFDSGIAEELTWSTADELIVNGRAYERGPESLPKDPTHRLLVAAFTWTGSGWIAVKPAKP
jgi:hypothetical protein